MNPPLAVAPPATWTSHAEWPGHAVRHAPGRHLGPAEQRALAGGLAAALPSLRMRAYFDVKPDTFSAADHVVVAFDPAERPIGALVSRWHALGAGMRFLHILAAFVGEEHQGGDLLWRMWAVHWAEAAPTPEECAPLVAFRTYNPRSYRALSGFARIDGALFYPRVPAGDQDPHLSVVAPLVVAAISPGHEIDVATGVIPGAAGGVPRDFYPELQLSGNEAVDEHFRTRLTPADRLLCLLALPTTEAKRRFVEAAATGRGPRAV